MRHEYGFHLKSKQEFPREDLQRADLVVRGLREGGRDSWCKGRACTEPGQGLGGQGALRFVCLDVLHTLPRDSLLAATVIPALLGPEMEP